MARQLIVDYLPFEITREQINESLKENNGRLIVHGVLQRSDAKNQNGRVYPHGILQRESKKYATNFVTQKRAMGELDHPESSVVNLQNVSHNVTEMHWEGKNLIGSVEVLGTPSGNILGELFKAGIKLGISSRGLGSVEPMQEGDDGAAYPDGNAPPEIEPEYMSRPHEIEEMIEKLEEYKIHLNKWAEEAADNDDDETLAKIQALMDENEAKLEGLKSENLPRAKNFYPAGRTGKELDQETLTIDGKQFRRISESVKKEPKPKYEFSEFYQRFKR